MRAGRYLVGQAFQPKNDAFLKKQKKTNKKTIYIKIIRLKLLERTPVFPLSYYPADGLSQKRSD